MATVSTPVRRYPSSLSHNPAGPSRPQRPGSHQSSIDDEVPAPPEFPPVPQPAVQQLPELSSLEHLLRQAGYKETRVFTPEAERIRPRLRRDFEEDGAAELADLYANMGLNNRDVPIQVRHLTKPAIPFRSSSSVLRSVALQDASATLNERQRITIGDEPPESWLATILRNRAAIRAGKTLAAMTPPPDDGPMDHAGVGLLLAKGGQGVRKTRSNYELGYGHTMSPQQEDISPEQYFEPQEPVTAAPPVAYVNGFNRTVPPAIADVFSPPSIEVSACQPTFDDDAFGYCPLPDDYEAQGDDDLFDLGDSYDSESSFAGSPPAPSPPCESPPLLRRHQALPEIDYADEDDLADAEEIAAAERDAAAIGQRILASTVEYDEDSDDEIVPYTQPLLPDTVEPAPASTPLPLAEPVLPLIEVQPASPPKDSTMRGIAEAMAETILLPAHPAIQPPAALPASLPSKTAKLRAAQSAPTLRKYKSARFAVSPALPAPPALQVISPVICDSVSTDAEDLPSLPVAPAVHQPPSGFGSIAVRARKSLSALRAAFWAEETAVSAPDTQHRPQDTPRKSSTPILTPRLDWNVQRVQLGWNSDSEDKGSRSSFDSAGSSGTMAELGNPFDGALDVDIDYTKSFFYKPETPPKPGGSANSSRSSRGPRKQRSIKSLRANMRIPVAAPPVPPLPDAFRTPTRTKSGTRTPPLPTQRLANPPQLCILSPGAWEEGRPARPLLLEGDEWDGHDVVENWGGGVRRGSKGKKKRRSRLTSSGE